MIDIYHFSNPFSPTCLKTEERLLHIKPDLAAQTNLRFIPLVHADVVAEYDAKRATLSDTPANMAHTIFHVVCDYKAAQIEGNKKARNFLVQIQQQVTHQKKRYSTALSIATAKQVGLDITDFLSNRTADETLSAVIAEQQLAQSMLQHQEAAIAIDDIADRDIQLLTDFSIANLVHTFGPLLGHGVTPAILQQHLETMA